jgi:hypothetical protein
VYTNIIIVSDYTMLLAYVIGFEMCICEAEIIRNPGYLCCTI